jgi:hypothetical protein
MLKINILFISAVVGRVTQTVYKSKSFSVMKYTRINNQWELPHLPRLWSSAQMSSDCDK